MITKLIKILVLLFFVPNCLAQGTNSYCSNFLQYNTGEIYVVFNTPGLQSRPIEDIEGDDIQVSQKGGLAIYPNPVSDMLYITGLDIAQYNSFQIFTLDGKSLIINKLDSKEINLSFLSRGVYLLNIYGVQTKTFKIIKI